jgi:PII-like signaling protein
MNSFHRSYPQILLPIRLSCRLARGCIGPTLAAKKGIHMLQKGLAKKVTIFINEDTQHHLSSLCDAILTFLLHKRISGATATRAMAGFGAHHVMHTTKIEVLAQHLPIRIEFIDSAEKVNEVMPTLYDMVTDGVIEVHDTQVVKVANKERPTALKMPHAETRGPARLMRVYMGESDKWLGEPLYEAILKQLRLMNIAGATVYRGILGYGAKGHTHKSGRLGFGHDLPVMISVVDSQEKLAKAIDEIEVMMQDGIIVLSDVDVIRLVHTSPAVET